MIFLILVFLQMLETDKKEYAFVYFVAFVSICFDARFLHFSAYFVTF